MTATVPGRAPSTDAELIRSFHDRLRRLERGQTARVGPWVLSSIDGDLIASKPGESFVLGAPVEAARVALARAIPVAEAEEQASILSMVDQAFTEFYNLLTGLSKPEDVIKTLADWINDAIASGGGLSPDDPMFQWLDPITGMFDAEKLENIAAIPIIAQERIEGLTDDLENLASAIASGDPTAIIEAITKIAGGTTSDLATWSNSLSAMLGSPPLASEPTTVTDLFDRPDSSTLGGGWVDRWNAIAIDDNCAVPDTSGDWCLATWPIPLGSNDMEVSFTVGAQHGAVDIDRTLPILGANAAGDYISGYVRAVPGGSGEQTARIFTNIGGWPFNGLEYQTDAVPVTYVDGDTITFRRAGNVYSILLNGSAIPGAIWTDSDDILARDALHRIVGLGVYGDLDAGDYREVKEWSATHRPEFNPSAAVQQFITDMLHPQNLLAPLVGGEVPVFNIPGLPQTKITNLVADLASRLLTTDPKIQFLSPGGLFDAAQLANITNIPMIAQGRVTNLVTDLAAKIAANSPVLQYLSAAGLYDASALTNMTNIPAIAQGKITNLVTDLAAKLTTTDPKVQYLSAAGLFDASALSNIANIPAIAIAKVTSLPGYLTHLSATGVLDAVASVTGLPGYLTNLTSGGVMALAGLAAGALPVGITLPGGQLTGAGSVAQSLVSNLTTDLAAKALGSDLTALMSNLGAGTATLAAITTRLAKIGSGGLVDAAGLTNIAGHPAIATSQVTNLPGYLTHLSTSGVLDAVGSVTGLPGYLTNLTSGGVMALAGLAAGALPSGITLPGGQVTGAGSLAQSLVANLTTDLAGKALGSDLTALMSNLGAGTATLAAITTRLAKISSGGLVDAAGLTNIAGHPAIATSQVTNLPGYLTNLNTSGVLALAGLASGALPAGITLPGGQLTGAGSVPQSIVANLVTDLAARLTSSSALNADNITTGALALARLAAGALPAAVTLPGGQVTGAGSIAQSVVANLVSDLAARLTSSSALNADNITTGALALARLATGALPGGITATAAQIASGVLATARVPDIVKGMSSDLQQLTDQITQSLVGGGSYTTTDITKTAAASARGSMDSLYQDVADLTRTLQDALTDETALSVAGRQFSINFADYPDGPLSAAGVTVTYSGAGTSTVSIQGGQAVWNLVNNGPRRAINMMATQTATDFQLVKGTMATAPEKSSDANPVRIWSIGRVNAAATSYVWARGYCTGFLTYKGDLGCTVSGVEQTAWLTGVSLTWSLDMTVKFGVGTVARQFEVWSGATRVASYTEAGTTSQLGASYRGWGAIAETNGKEIAGKINGASCSDNQVDTSVGSGARMIRVTTSTVNFAAGASQTDFPNGYFDTVPDQTADISVITAGSPGRFTVTYEGWYIISLSVEVTGSNSARIGLGIKKNGTLWQMGSGQYSVAGMCQSTFVIYLKANEYVTPCYYNSDISQWGTRGQTDGSRTYFEIVLANRSLK